MAPSLPRSAARPQADAAGPANQQMPFENGTRTKKGRHPKVTAPGKALLARKAARRHGPQDEVADALPYLERASSTATAQATVAPTMGLLPMPMRPIMSTCAGTEEEPANWASECMRPMVSVMP